MRLIDGDALMETIRAHDYPLRAYFNSTDNGMFTLGIQQAVDEQPTVDAVPVVRCRDCELWNDWDSAGKESLGNYVCSCAHWSVEDGAVLYTRPTDYCSYGERKGGDE